MARRKNTAPARIVILSRRSAAQDDVNRPYGNRTMNVVPSPGSLSTSIVP